MSAPVARILACKRGPRYRRSSEGVKALRTLLIARRDCAPRRNVGCLSTVNICVKSKLGVAQNSREAACSVASVKTRRDISARLLKARARQSGGRSRERSCGINSENMGGVMRSSAKENQ